MTAPPAPATGPDGAVSSFITPQGLGLAGLHKLLERQLLRQFGSLEAVPPGLAPLLAAIDASYRDADEGRLLVERSLELTSDELNTVNAGLRTEVETRRRNEEVQKAILESALDCIILMDEEGAVREFNPAATRTFGWSREEAVGRPLADLIIPPELRERHRGGLARYLATGEGPVLRRRIEIEGQARDGRRVPVELAIIPFQVGGATMFAGYMRDISDRLRSQTELTRRNATIHLLQQVPILAAEAESVEEAVRVCLERIGHHTGWPVGHAYFWEPLDESALGILRSRGVWHLETPQRFDAFRRATETQVVTWGRGLPGRVWRAGRPAWVLDLAHETDAPRAGVAAECDLRSGFAFPVAVRGRLLAVLEFYSPEAKAPDDEIVASLASLGVQLGGVLDRKRAEAELKSAYERLQLVDRERTQFLNNAAHELGTPLTPIKLQVELLKGRLDGTDAVQRKSLDILDRNIDRLGRLVKDLLDSARLQAGQMRLEPHPTDLGEAARTSVEAYRTLAQERGIELRVAASPGLVVHADAARLGQVFDNLLSNALKFTPRGGHVTVHTWAQGEHAVATVQDNGLGIPPDGLPRLFRPFSQLHDMMEQSHPGTGLGLYISRGIVETCGGTLSCDSAGPGRGSTFTVRLPLAGAEATPPAAPP